MEFGTECVRSTEKDTGCYLVHYTEWLLTKTILKSSPSSRTSRTRGLNGKLYYTITSGDDSGDFDIAENGTIYTRKLLDRETVPAYNLVVTARDMPKPPEPQMSSTVQVFCHSVAEAKPPTAFSFLIEGSDGPWPSSTPARCAGGVDRRPEVNTPRLHYRALSGAARPPPAQWPLMSAGGSDFVYSRTRSTPAETRSKLALAPAQPLLVKKDYDTKCYGFSLVIDELSSGDARSTLQFAAQRSLRNVRKASNLRNCVGEFLSYKRNRRCRTIDRMRP
ncbi:Protocadherin Fat 4 [Eumeta japonica]|uniref:Protocadherin Fat 4 n=1 Tax=Eumeta variegata TaxID=151549 RepID=A0A4C1WHR0_EUMVA|nr:Protocadherin Fat 4 [Eumeta japonica]